MINNKKVVVIGGGTGLATLLRGLKKYNLDLSAIVTVADDGGSSGRLRDELAMIPPGDIRNVLVAMADTEPLLEKLLQHRFNRGANLLGHSVGNLLLAAMEEITGDLKSAIQALSKVLAVRGKVLPAADQPLQLAAKMCDGRLIFGESAIPKAGGRIEEVYINPADTNANSDAIEAIACADLIVIGPGSLYTSILPVLLVKQMTEAIQKSKADKIYICNVMTQPGETDDYTAADHVEALYKHVKQHLFSTVICHRGEMPVEVSERYLAEGAKLVDLTLDELKAINMNVIVDDFCMHNTFYRHDPDKISKFIYEYIRDKLN